MRNQPALKAALLFSLGIALGRRLGLAGSRIPWLAGFGSACILLLLFRRRIRSPVAMLLLVVAAGWVRIGSESFFLPANHLFLHAVPSRPVSLTAFLIRDPIRRLGRTDLVLEAERIQAGDSAFFVSGKVLVSLYEGQADSLALGYGDLICASGTFEHPRGRRNPGGFDYRAYLERQGIRLLFKPAGPIRIATAVGSARHGSYVYREVVYPVRRFVLRTIDRTTDAYTRPLLRALVVGDQAGIPEDIRDGFSKSGAVHILSVSGSHVGFVFLILSTVLGLLRFPRAVRIGLTAAGLVFYCLLAECSPPVVRATVMAIVVLVGVLIDRNVEPFNTIGTAALAVLLVRPQDLFDLGFQLSFASVLSIVYFYQKLKSLPVVQAVERKIASHPSGRFVFSAVLVSVAAQIGTVPLVAYSFNQIPLLSVFANLIAIPLSGLIVALGFTTIGLAPVHFSAASVYGSLNQVLLSVFARVVVWIGNLPFSHIDVPSPDWIQGLLFIVLAVLIVHLGEPRPRNRLVFAGLLLANLSVWKTAAFGHPERLTWIQFDVGQGDAALFRLPRGRSVLVDGGMRTPAWDAGESVLVPCLRKMGIRTLETVVLTHAHDDHIGGLQSILDQFHVRQVVSTGVPGDSPYFLEWVEQIKAKGIAHLRLRAPDSLQWPGGVKAYILSPGRGASSATDDCNEHSLVMRIHYGEIRWMLMGDAGTIAEERLAASGLDLDCHVLKVGHHGSRSASSERFLRHTRPGHTVISVGLNNRFGHPDPSVISRFERAGIAVHRTDQSGAVVVQTDGKKLQVSEYLRK